MTSHRLEKINELIKQELGKIIFAQEEFGPGVLVTVLYAKTSEDLKNTSIIFSVLPTEKGWIALKQLNNHIFDLQQSLNKKLRMHPVPKIRFVLNEDESKSQQIDTLLEKTKGSDPDTKAR